MAVTKLPILLDSSLRPVEQLHPESLSIDLALAPLSTAEMILPGHGLVSVGQFVGLFTPTGSAGIFRVNIVDESLGSTARITLEHGLCTLSDGLIVGKGEQKGSARTLLGKVLASQPTRLWQLGTVAVPDSELLTWSWEYSNALESLMSILDELPAYVLTFDQTTKPWTMHLLKSSDDDGCECRLNRNLETVSVSTDRTELCTRLYIPGVDTPLDADTIGTWGVVARYLDADPAIGTDALKREGAAYLEAHKNPQLTVTLDALDLSEATGQPFDHFTAGSICRVCLPDYQQLIRQRVVRIHYPDVFGEPDRASVTLASEADTAVSTLSSLIVDTTVMRKRFSSDIRTQYDLIIAAENAIKLYANEIEILAKDVSLKADTVLLDAYVKITELEAEILNVLQYASVPNLIAGKVIATDGSFSTLAANSVDATGSLSVGGDKASWQSTEVITGVGGRGVTGEYKTIQYLNWNGEKASTSVMTGFTQGAFSTSTKTLNYLGNAPTD